LPKIRPGPTKPGPAQMTKNRAGTGLLHVGPGRILGKPARWQVDMTVVAVPAVLSFASGEADARGERAV